jgi:hypothetical protein
MSTTKKNTKRSGNAANNGGKWIRPSKRLAIYLRDGFRCAYCGAVLEDGATQLTLDHVTPQELGGSNHESNLVCCCKSCNSAKQDKPLRAFLAYLAEQGVDVTDVPKRIRRVTRRSLKKYKAAAKAIRAARR